ncbi:MAG: CHASE3 domain-containing protein [Candidatus Sericytochromatia bacterium]|nr:CHASE3 domain-containing protein [Candidatus Sericytochromatia bacterium]
MKLYIDKKVFLGFGFVILIVLSTGLISYLSIIDLVSSSKWVTHTCKVINEVNKVNFLVNEVELSTFKHAITRKNDYGKIYFYNKNLINNSIKHIKDLTSDNSFQQKNLIQLQSIIDKKFSLLERLMQIENIFAELSLSKDYINSPNNEKIRNNIIQTIKVILDEENRLLILREKKAANYIPVTIYIIILGTFLSFLITLSSIYIINKDLFKRRLAESKLRDNEINLEKKIYERTLEISHSNNYLKEEVNERKKVEKSLRLANDELNNFAYIASHDLQEPLRTISSYTQLLHRRAKDKLNQEESEFMDLIIDGSTRMKALIEDLLYYSRVGKNERKHKNVDLNRVIENTLYNLKLSIDETKAKITYPKLPTIIADETQLVQLFQNIINNSIKYQSDKNPIIEISYEKKDNEHFFSIKDNGIGIEPQYYEKIFVIFQRLHNRSEYSGTGIGLSTCKKIIDQHNGKIWLDSKKDQGTIFYFTIPK